MNILYLCDEYPPGRHGGIGTVVQLLARELVKQGHNVVVAGFYDWGYGGEDEFEDNGVKVYRFRRGLSSTAFHQQDALAVRAMYKALHLSGIFQWDVKRSLKKYKRYIEEIVAKHAVDIIEMPEYNDYIRFCHQPVYFPSLPVPAVVKLHGSMTYFAREAGDNVPQYVLEIEKDILHKATRVAAVSEYTAVQTARYLDYNEPIEVLYNGIDLPPVEKAITKVHGKVVFTGTLISKKGIYQLVQAWNDVIKRHPEARLYVYGKGPVDKIKALLNKTAADTVLFMGHVSREQLFRELASAHMAVFPSFAECFALAPMEAMACETPVIYTTRTSGGELIEHMKDGMLVDPADIDDIAGKICYLLENHDICARIAAAGRQKVVDQFSMPVVAARHIQYYQAVLQGKQ